MKQVVTVAPDGSLSSLHHKEQGLDLREFGKVEIERTSDIKWDNDYQLWYIEIINGPKSGTIITVKEWQKTEEPLPKQPIVWDCTDGIIRFKEYEDAVKAEIIFLDGLRKKGIF